MQLQDAIRLITDPALLKKTPTIWADLGCGSGLFTQALANILFAGSTIYAVDSNMKMFEKTSAPNIAIKVVEADFVTDELGFGALDGLLMANSLHFVIDKIGFLNKIKSHIKPEGIFVIIEYDLDTPNPWVPYPIGFTALKSLFDVAGYRRITRLYELPSLYNRANIYSAVVAR